MNNNQTLGWQASIGNDTQQEPRRAAPTVPQSSAAGAPIGHTAGIASTESPKKTVLLVDSNRQSRESRAKVMRTLGVLVECVANTDAARVRLVDEKYNLILVDPGRDVAAAELLVNEIKTRNCRQLVGFLVGSPLFIATSLRASNSRPHRAPAASTGASVAKLSTPAFTATDFGRRIRDAEAKEIA